MLICHSHCQCQIFEGIERRLGPAHDLLVQVAKAGQRVDDSGEIISSDSSQVLILLQMVAASLLGFYREGWEPMTPIDTASKANKRGNQVNSSSVPLKAISTLF